MVSPWAPGHLSQSLPEHRVGALLLEDQETVSPGSPGHLHHGTESLFAEIANALGAISSHLDVIAPGSGIVCDQIPGHMGVLGSSSTCNDEEYCISAMSVGIALVEMISKYMRR